MKYEKNKMNHVGKVQTRFEENFETSMVNKERRSVK